MNHWNMYTPRELAPRGWLKRQLRIQADGLSGHLDKMWPDVRDSAWIGGEAEGWERVPYWLDGFVPLAYLLRDEDMIARAKRYMDAILARQREDGWICPCTDEQRPKYDPWGALLITKVLVVYYECSGDERAADAVYRALKNLYKLFVNKEWRLVGWGYSRWFEGMIAVNFCYNRTHEEWLRELAVMYRDQGAKYPDYLPLWERPLNLWHHPTHIVNVVMALKYEAVSHELLGEDYKDMAEVLHAQLERYNGTPVGLFTGDECLSGLSPIHGTELCSVVEQMYSYEQLYAYTGDAKWAERLELVAFNALPATISDDMWTHQYVQMSNQMACQKMPSKGYGNPIFRTVTGEAHLFGLEPHYGCCTANFNQGWPKLALSAFMHSGDTVVSVLPIPSELNDDTCAVTLDTDYPFRNEMTYTVKAKKSFTLKIRIPSFAKSLRVDGVATEAAELTFALAAGEERVVRVTFETEAHFIDRPHDLKSVKCGSLVFSLPIAHDKKMLEFERKGVERKFPYCDYELIPTADWGYAYSDTSLSVERHEINDIPFSSEHPAVTVKVKMTPIRWGLEDGFESVCAKVPESREPAGEQVEMTLHPYGTAKLRMTELPLI